MEQIDKIKEEMETKTKLAEMHLLNALKLKYFSSRFFSVQNWVMFDRVKLPEGLTIKDMEDWAEEKGLYLAQEKINIELIKTSYQHILIDRLDAIVALQEEIKVKLVDGLEDTKDLNNISRSLKTIADIQDETMKLLKVDSFQSLDYEKNQVATDSLIKNHGRIVVEFGGE